MARISGIPEEYRVGRIRRWQTPPNWSPRDWHEELDSIEAAAICFALLEFDEDRGVPVSAFVRCRVLTHAYTRYRQEWSYLKHFDGLDPTESARSHDPISSIIDSIAFSDCLSRLSPDQVILLDHLYCRRSTESQVGDRLGISHQAVNKRKRTALRRLRECMECQKK